MPLFLKFLALLGVLFLSLVNTVDALQAKAWQSLDELVPSASFEFPEKSILDQQPGRVSAAIGFTGGGSRSFIASFGYMSALHSMDKMDKFSYVGGISGGSWATTVYTYSQHDPADEAEFLGSIDSPELISREKLQVMSAKCARRLTNSAFTTIVLGSIDKCPSLGEMWCYATQEVYMSPVGIPRDMRWAYTQAQVDEIKNRNPELRNEPFLLPNNPKRSFPILGSTLIGPEEGAPYTYKRNNQNYTFFEMTPYYVGHVKKIHMEYNSNKKHSDTVQKRTVGGFLETFAFSRASNRTDGEDIAPREGLKEGVSMAVLEVPAPSGILDLGRAAGASSYAPGAFFDSFDIQKPTSLHFNYYSPTDPTSGGQTVSTRKNTLFDTVFADGGSLENIPLISFIQRGVKRILYCSNSVTPLQPSSKWNVDAPGAINLPDQIDSSISAFFGIFPGEDHHFEDRSYQYERDQIFATSEYSSVIKGLQAAQSSGTGIFYRAKLTTVENTWWGVKAGVEVDLTIMVLGRLPVWESRLSSEMRKLVVPDNSGDLSETISHGPFKHFPHYGTSGADINYEQANLLADMTGWSVLQNLQFFEDI
jgi:hypothetical protein